MDALLFLDVDGPLIPFGAADDSARPELLDANPLLARLDPQLGPLLAALPCRLVWATTWMHEANTTLSPILGLPELTVLEWPTATDDRVDQWFGLHWKTRALVDWAAGRPFIWVDDEITDRDQDWVAAEYRGSALLHRVDPRKGLQRSDFEVFGAWFAAHPD
ncbi:HAD domain-containing protein [Nocardia brasiliensis]|uniref:Secreted protein n=1 Tax=Nocardia brasiliensis (strain ATCC 700358 / HUJEG-1) TaxID=1133849 RepID=K0EKN9_NOCB7|nr:HAD domain-containing protein [Nocardia brasiliensis]AFU00003.1 hypothetical protein O3I_010210 [Nocardia brasiliensis ATCC 700358]OCF84979.1 hypothetical protein AW168_38655 [Nocardia brasiliensis]